MGCPLVKVTNTLEQQWLYSLAIWPDRPRDLHKEVGQVGGCLLRNSSAQGTSSSVCCAAEQERVGRISGLGGLMFEISSKVQQIWYSSSFGS